MNITRWPNEGLNPWFYRQENRCPRCGATWHLNEHDQVAPWWRQLLAWLPMPTNDDQHASQYFTRDLPAEAEGVPGTYLVSRCPYCGAQVWTRKQEKS